MAEVVPIAPNNYERWMVIHSPLLVAEAGAGGRWGFRHTEGLVEVGASLSRLDSRNKESLIEQSLQPGKRPRKVFNSKPQAPLMTSHPGEWVLRQPLPMATLVRARGHEAVDPRKVTGLYTHAEPAAPTRVRLSG